MTTPRIEEIKSNFRTAVDGLVYAHVDSELAREKAQRNGAVMRDGGRILCQRIVSDGIVKQLEIALTQAHQAGIDAAVEIIKEELRKAPLEVQMTKGIIFANIISRITQLKTTADYKYTNSEDSSLSHKEAN